MRDRRKDRGRMRTRRRRRTGSGYTRNENLRNVRRARRTDRRRNQRGHTLTTSTISGRETGRTTSQNTRRRRHKNRRQTKRIGAALSRGHQGPEDRNMKTRIHNNRDGRDRGRTSTRQATSNITNITNINLNNYISQFKAINLGLLSSNINLVMATTRNRPAQKFKSITTRPPSSNNRRTSNRRRQAPKPTKSSPYARRRDS